MTGEVGCRERGINRGKAGAARRAIRGNRRKSFAIANVFPRGPKCLGARGVRRVRDHAAGFVDHDDVGVFVDDRYVDRFGDGNRRQMRGNLELENVALGERTSGFARDAVHPYVAAFEGLRDQPARSSA